MGKRDHSRRDGGPSQRRLRVGEELRHALARVLERGELRDPALQNAAITVTEVRVSPDLKNATAYVMPLGGRHAEETLAALRRGSGYLRGVLAREVDLRHAPTIGFALDTSFDHASHIDALLHRPEVARDLEARENPGASDGSADDDGT